MKVYIVSEGSLNTGYECQVRCICASRELANQIADSFNYLGLSITEFNVIGSGNEYLPSIEKIKVTAEHICDHVWANELLLSMPPQRRCVKCGLTETILLTVPCASAPAGSVLKDCGKDGWQWVMPENGYEGHVCYAKDVHEE